MSWCVSHKLEQPCWKCLEISRIEKAPLKPADAAEWKALAEKLYWTTMLALNGDLTEEHWTALQNEAREMGLKVEERDGK